MRSMLQQFVLQLVEQAVHLSQMRGIFAVHAEYLGDILRDQRQFLAQVGMMFVYNMRDQLWRRRIIPDIIPFEHWVGFKKSVQFANDGVRLQALLLRSCLQRLGASAAEIDFHHFKIIRCFRKLQNDIFNQGIGLKYRLFNGHDALLLVDKG
ncbi:hypothetical protein D3C71_1710900 [compost metagenome]